jgi:hypothetical protein
VLLLGQRKIDGLEQPFPQLRVFQVECFVYPDEFRPRRSATVFGLDGSTYLLAMVIDALAAAASDLLICDLIRLWRTSRIHQQEWGLRDPCLSGQGLGGGNWKWYLP